MKRPNHLASGNAASAVWLTFESHRRGVPVLTLAARPKPVKAFRIAVLLGTVSAGITWVVAFALLHEPNPRMMPDGSFLLVTDHGSDPDLIALLWAAGVYVVTFTPALFLMRHRILPNVFQKRQSNG